MSYEDLKELAIICLINQVRPDDFKWILNKVVGSEAPGFAARLEPSKGGLGVGTQGGKAKCKSTPTSPLKSNVGNKRDLPV